MIKDIKLLLALLTVLFFHSTIYAQVQHGLSNPGFESNSGCPTTFSQFNLVDDWYNPVSNFVSTPDFFNDDCGFLDFASPGLSIEANPNDDFQGCGRMGIFLNYKENPLNLGFREYIGQAVQLVSGRTYILNIDLQRAAAASPSGGNGLQRNFAVYGYSGSFPATHTNYCINGADELAIISESLITFSNDRHQVQFTPLKNYSHIILGAACDSIFDATDNGYVFIDYVELLSTDNSTLTPAIKHAGELDNLYCCFNGLLEDFVLFGNTIPIGATATWSQDLLNPATVTFANPNDSTTYFTGSGHLPIGQYEFYYTFSKGGISITDTLNFEVVTPLIVSISSRSDCSGALSPSNHSITPKQYENSYWQVMLGDGIIDSFTSDFHNLVDTSGFLRSVYSGFINEASFYLPVDTTTWILTERDVNCNGNWVSDTMTIIHRHIVTDYEEIYCLGDTGLINLELSTNSHLLKLMNSVSVSINFVSGPATPNFLNPAYQDSFLVVFNATGTYKFNVQAQQDSCIWFTNIEIEVREPLDTAIADNISFCSRRSGTSYQLAGRIPTTIDIQKYGYLTWWGVIKEDSSVHIFPNSAGVADSGQYVTNNAGDTVLRGFLNGITPYLPVDYQRYIWFVQDTICTDIIFTDTIIVLFRHVAISPLTIDPTDLCPPDTLLLVLDSFNNNYLPNFPNISVQWSQTIGPSATFLNPNGVDSIYVVLPSPGFYTFRVTATDSICSWYQEVSMAEPDTFLAIDAGADIEFCETVFSPIHFIPDNRLVPSFSAATSKNFSYWLGVMINDSIEHVFPTQTSPNDGPVAYVKNGDDSILVTKVGSNIEQHDYGTFKIVYHIESCLGTVTQDTACITWNFLEPLANAGIDTQYACQAFSLDGNVSALSAGNSGCAQWKQISGPSQVAILNADYFQAFVAGLDTAITGSYEFEYLLGCEPCQKIDTVRIFINTTAGQGNVGLNYTDTASKRLCLGDTVTITASGGVNYTYFVNNVQYLTPTTEDTLQIILPSDTNLISVLVTDSSGCFFSSNSSLTILANCAVILPIDLTSFEVDETNCPTLTFNWATATEINTEKFELYALDEYKNVWEVIGELDAAGNSSTNKHYSYTYNTNGTNHKYFKIRTIDNNGSFEESSLITANCGDTWDEVNIYPNPGSGNINIHTNFNVEEVMLYDDSGKMMYNGSLQSLNTANLPSGIYLITIVGKDSVFNERFIKIN